MKLFSVGNTGQEKASLVIVEKLNDVFAFREDYDEHFFS